jgi:hypothetical protein
VMHQALQRDRTETQATLRQEVRRVRCCNA